MKQTIRKTVFNDIGSATIIYKPMTLEEAINHHLYILQMGATKGAQGRLGVNLKPRTFEALVTSLNRSSENLSSKGISVVYMLE